MNKQYYNFAVKMCKHAKKVMLKYFTPNNGGYYKADHTIVTKADNEINEYLIKQVKKYFPTHSVDGEECDYEGKSKHVWICDPVDGTAMYARQFPVAVFSLALVENGDPVFGVILDPFTNKMFYASKGEGAYINGKPIHVNQVGWEKMKTIGQADVWPAASWDIIGCIKKLYQISYPVSIGSIAHACAFVASGDFSYAIFPGTKEKHCDVAAAKIIVEEAGGRVTDFDGNNQRYDTHINGVVMTNGVLHDDILKLIKTHAKKRDEEKISN